MLRPAPESSSSPSLFGLSGFAADWVGVFALFFVYAGELVPGVNEPHYWTKSAHFWDSSFGRGDLFLESGNAHWLFYASLGWFASVLSLPSAAWVARFVLWGMLATGWTWMIRSLLTTSNPNQQSTNTFSTVAKSALPLVSTLCGAGWLAGMHWGHWAGEWVVGGAEAKVAAYACIFGALGCFFRGQVWLAWLLLGLASAFHIVTGIWVMGCCVLVSLALTDPGPARWQGWARRNVGPLLAAVPFVAVGAIPPLAMDWGVPKEIVGEAAVIQVYGRLGHHLAPSLFAEVRWQSFGLLLAMGCLVHWFALKVPFSRWPYGLKWVVLNAWLALGIAVVGTLIDVVLGGIDRTLAAKILKFYWFRWNDVAWALGVAAPVTAMAYGMLGSGSMRYGKIDPRTVSAIAVALLVGVGGWLMGTRYFENSEAWIPFGDKARFLSKWDDESARRQQYHDWLEVCDWIEDNTDSEGVWLTPRNQQSFKWHTHRPELACTKDMPQNSAAIVEWAKRLEDAYKLDEAKIQLPWTTQRLWELHEKYAVRYVLLDHRVPQQTPPLLPILYPPPGVTNATFSVYEFPTSPSHSTTK